MNKINEGCNNCSMPEILLCSNCRDKQKKALKKEFYTEVKNKGFNENKIEFIVIN